jgi:hypothetical protein
MGVADRLVSSTSVYMRRHLHSKRYGVTRERVRQVLKSYPKPEFLGRWSREPSGVGVR